MLNDTLGPAVPLQVRFDNQSSLPQQHILLSTLASFVVLVQAQSFAHTSMGR